jgi:putative hemolysin
MSNHESENNQIFDLIPAKAPWSGLNPLLMGLTGLLDLKNVYQQVGGGAKNCGEFLDAALGELGISWDVPERERGQIPKQGPLIAVANHPFGGAEAMILARLLLQIRPDVKIMANYLLQRLPELKDLILPVDPFGRTGSAAANIGAVKHAIRWVRGGGALAVFPAGEVAHFELENGRVEDPEWKEAVGRLVQKTGAPVVPVFFPGKNDAWFQAAGVLHPQLRTALLGRELLNKRGRQIRVRVGQEISAARLGSFTPGECIRYLRNRTDLLAAPPAHKRTGIRWLSVQVPVAADAPGDLLAREISSLPEKQKLVQSGGIAAWIAEAAQIPHLMREIGRLREETFRAMGEGTGRTTDMDRFDRTYLQLFLWDEKKQMLVGGYRLGATDRVPELYTRSLFHYSPAVLEKIAPALELGRSFVRREYQKSYLPLLLLWKGIGRFLVQNPRYRHLFGAVSMSADYSHYSRVLLATYLDKHHRHPVAVDSKTRNPLEPSQRRESCLNLEIQSLEELAEIIRQVEPDGKDIPVLFSKYLELGGRILGFQIDRKFNHTLDGLIVVDLDKANRRLLDFYLTRDGAEQYFGQCLPSEV